MKRFHAPVPEAGLGPYAERERRSERGAALYSYVWQGGLAPAVPLRPYRQGLKRITDILLVLAALPFALPLIGLCALALWREGGQPFYTQERVGLGGRRFRILKLRTMVTDAGPRLRRYLAENPAARDEWNRMQKLEHDPRITPVGNVLRVTSMDELPQLWNVLRGDMSLVGPRPMMPEQQALYGPMEDYLTVRPGITGLWQVSLRNRSTFATRNQVDARYARELTAALDLSILWRTVGVVLRRTGK